MSPLVSAQKPYAGKARNALRWRLGVTIGLIGAIMAFAVILAQNALPLRPDARNLAPALGAPFGTDVLGRDLFARVIIALGASIKLGLMAAALSTGIAVVLALLASFNRVLRFGVELAGEMALGLPHFVLIMLTAYAMGGGSSGIILGVGLTHWPRLARLLQHQISTMTHSEPLVVSRQLGRGPLWIAQHHLLPALAPLVLVGFVLTFPHAVLHEAGISFVGLGSEPHLPSIGIMLSEALRPLMAGYWWMALFPGLGLMSVALMVEISGEALRRHFSPTEGVA